MLFYLVKLQFLMYTTQQRGKKGHLPSQDISGLFVDKGTARSLTPKPTGQSCHGFSGAFPITHVSSIPRVG